VSVFLFVHDRLRSQAIFEIDLVPLCSFRRKKSYLLRADSNNELDGIIEQLQRLTNGA
jgi:hypothetical protein